VLIGKSGLGGGGEEGKVPHPHLASFAPILYRSNIRDGGIENFIHYIAFRSKITPVLQARFEGKCNFFSSIKLDSSRKLALPRNVSTNHCF